MVNIFYKINVFCILGCHFLGIVQIYIFVLGWFYGFVFNI